VVETPLGRFRQPYAKKNIGGMNGANYISYKYTLAHPGRPHVALAEYPDDTVRFQEMRLVEMLPWGGGNAGRITLGNHSAILGLENPLTQEIRRHHTIFWPSRTNGTVTIFSEGRCAGGWDPSMAARVGKSGFMKS